MKKNIKNASKLSKSVTHGNGKNKENFIYNKDWFFVGGITVSYRFPLNPECHF